MEPNSKQPYPCSEREKENFVDACLRQNVILGCVQTGATTPNIIAPTMLGIVACVLAVVCKRMQQLTTMLGPAVRRGKDTTPKSL